ncbi:MAG: MoaD family protein [Nanoarchaeota archaeon]
MPLRPNKVFPNTYRKNQNNNLILPIQFQKLIGASELEYKAKNIQDLLNQFIKQYPDLKERIFDKSGQINKFINIYVNSEDIRFLGGLKTKLKNNNEVLIIPSIAGG